MSRFMDVCRLFEKNDPPIKKLMLDGMVLNSCYQSIVITIACDEEEHRFKYCSLKSPSMWTCFGQAMRKNKTLETLVLYLEPNQHANTIDVPPEAEQSINEFFSGLIKNKSIKTFYLQFSNSTQVPVFGLDRFVRYKKRLNKLCIWSKGKLLPSLCLTLATAVKRNSVVALDLRGCGWCVDGVYDVVSACSNVKMLHLSQSNTRGAIDQAFTILCGILSENNHTLTLLIIECHSIREVSFLKSWIWSSISELMLQDPSSIDCICNSNHTLEKLVLTLNGRVVYACDKKILLLNRCKNKSRVIQEKIAYYYLRGDFDVAPFANMNLWLLPKVMNLISKDDDDRQQNAIYKLVRGIPDLCNFRGKNAGQLVCERKVRRSQRIKRQKVSN